jgi:hypothetical protein
MFSHSRTGSHHLSHSTTVALHLLTTTTGMMTTMTVVVVVVVVVAAHVAPTERDAVPLPLATTMKLIQRHPTPLQDLVGSAQTRLRKAADVAEVAVAVDVAEVGVEAAVGPRGATRAPRSTSASGTMHLCVRVRRTRRTRRFVPTTTALVAPTRR